MKIISLIQFYKSNILLVLFVFCFCTKGVSQETSNGYLKTSYLEYFLEANKDTKRILFLINKKEVTKEAVSELDTIAIKSIYILKGKSATNKYGKKASNGAVEITTKQKWKVSKVVKINQNRSIYSFLKTQKNKPGFPLNIKKALIVVDENISNKKVIDSIALLDLVSFKFLKATDEKAIKYGDAAKNGVILVQTKKSYFDFLEKHKAHLFVIDGIPSSLQNAKTLHPSKIKSINILKEAAASAIYGSRGKNGVVLIALKKI